MIISTKKGTPKDELEKIVDKFDGYIVFLLVKSYPITYVI